MNQFVVGDAVTNGVRSGVVCESFYWANADDGTYNKPDSSDSFVPVMWSDGTMGYRPSDELDYE